MRNIITELMYNPYAWLILSLIAIVSAILSIVFYIKGNRVKKINYCKSTYNIIRNINNEIQGLKIYYDENLIENLSISKIIIWNSGNTKIEESDFASTIPFVIEANENCKILNSSILSVSEDANSFYLDYNEEKNMILIHFEYVDPKQGLVVQILHTGSSENLCLAGKVKGGRSINNREYINDSLSDILFRKLFKNKTSTIVFFSLLFFYFIIGILIPGIMLIKDNPILMSKYAFLAFLMIFIVSCYYIIEHKNVNKIPKKLRNDGNIDLF